MSAEQMRALAGQLRPRETYGSEGPKCPCCGRQYTADEPGYYDENGYTEETCDNCGETFDVSVSHSVSWTCTERLPASASLLDKEPQE